MAPADSDDVITGKQVIPSLAKSQPVKVPIVLTPLVIPYKTPVYLSLLAY